MSTNTPQPAQQTGSTSSAYQAGRNTVLSLLQHSPERVSKLFCSKTNKPERRLNQIEQLAREHRIPLSNVPDSKLHQLLTSTPSDNEAGAEHPELRHQGVVALVQAQALLDLDDLLNAYPKGQPGLVLLLDGIQDAHNLGAILRVADAAGCAGVILPDRRSATLSPSVSKVACGAEASVPIASVHNAAQALKQLKDAGFWSVASCCDSGAQRYDQVAYDMPVVLVLGNEEKGVRPALKKACDFHVWIPMLGVVSSLNVSCAAAVLSMEIAKQQERFKVG